MISASKNSGYRRKMIPFIVFATALLFAIFLCEVGLRVVSFEYPSLTRRDFQTGYAFMPNRRWIHRSEGLGEVSTNRFGFRDVEWKLEKPEQSYRIAVVGDSFVAALEVDREKRFTELLAKRLEREAVHLPGAVEIMNFGLPGFGPAQELQVLRHKVARFQPDMVLLAVFTGNDICNNSRELEREPILPYFELDGGSLRLDTSFREYRSGRWIQFVKGVTAYSRLAQLAYRSVVAVECHREQRAESDAQSSTLKREFGFNRPKTEMPVYSPPQTPEWKHAWEITDALLREFQRETAAMRAELRVVTLSNDVQVHPDEPLRRRLRKLLEVEDLFYPDDRIERICAAHGIESLHLARELRQLAETDQIHLHGFSKNRLGFGHWNELGHQAAADRIGRWLAAALNSPSHRRDLRTAGRASSSSVRDAE